MCVWCAYLPNDAPWLRYRVYNHGILWLLLSLSLRATHPSLRGAPLLWLVRSALSLYLYLSAFQVHTTLFMVRYLNLLNYFHIRWKIQVKTSKPKDKYYKTAFSFAFKIYCFILIIVRPGRFNHIAPNIPYFAIFFFIFLDSSEGCIPYFPNLTLNWHKKECKKECVREGLNY